MKIRGFSSRTFKGGYTSWSKSSVSSSSLSSGLNKGFKGRTFQNRKSNFGTFLGTSIFSRNLENFRTENLPNPKDSSDGLSTHSDGVMGLAFLAGFVSIILACYCCCCCCCYGKKTNHKEKKEFEMVTTNPRPKAVTPPYFSDGVVNKGPEGVSDDITKAGMMFNPEQDTSPCSALDHTEPWLKPSDDLGTEGSYQPYDSRLPNGYFYPKDYRPRTEEMMNMKNKEWYDLPYLLHYKVRGLPDPYAMGEKDNKTQHISLSFDESHDSGYSTPNSRSRQVIREVIV